MLVSVSSLHYIVLSTANCTLFVYRFTCGLYACTVYTPCASPEQAEAAAAAAQISRRRFPCLKINTQPLFIVCLVVPAQACVSKRERAAVVYVESERKPKKKPQCVLSPLLALCSRALAAAYSKQPGRYNPLLCTTLRFSVRTQRGVNLSQTLVSSHETLAVLGFSLWGGGSLLGFCSANRPALFAFPLVGL